MLGYNQNFDLFFRWIHVFAAIIWIGHLYFFNWVNASVQPKLDGPTKKLVNPVLLPRALFWFRWGAMITFISGWILFSKLYMHTPGVGWGPSIAFTDPATGGMSGRAMWILMGMILASVMWFNVWFIIWPAQKKIIPAVRDGVAADAVLVKRATFASKMNTYLSAPMLFGMVGAQHYGSMDWKIALIVIVFSEAVIWHMYKVSAKGGASI